MRHDVFSKQLKIINVVGTRPNFVKIAPLIKEYKNYPGIKAVLVHTYQHHDKNMSDVFFKDLEIAEPDYNLGVMSETVRSRQIAKIMSEFEIVCLKEKPNLVLVVGDVNSTIACALVAYKLGIRVAHVEAGLRSFDRTMPEEINRIKTDTISDLLFVSEKSGLKNLKKEGIPADRYFLVGNIMIDSLIHFKKRIEAVRSHKKYNLEKGNYAVLTLHRPHNVDSKKDLDRVLSTIEELQKKFLIVMPLHPRTKDRINRFNLFNKVDNMKNLILTEPLGYINFMNLVINSKLVLTDSGGIQEETTFLKIPCITLRNNTERPVTIKKGTNVLVGSNKDKIIGMFDRVLEGKWKKGEIPEFWDGQTAKRIVKIIIDKLLYQTIN
jgi:UDP-N-acetylglucosamine 2-epimerase (non-hydrolysing)